MFYLSAFVGAELLARAVITDATNVFIAAGKLRAAFPECDRVEVHSGTKRLFTVDTDGKIHSG